MILRIMVGENVDELICVCVGNWGHCVIFLLSFCVCLGNWGHCVIYLLFCNKVVMFILFTLC